MPFPILPSNSASGYNLTKSLRFRGSANAYLNRSAYPTSSGTKYTFSVWLKFGTLASVGVPDLLCFVNTSASRQAGIGFSNAGTGALTWWEYAGSYTIQKITSQLFRDPSAWYHIVCTWDSANATADDRAIIYVNGVRVTAFSTNTNPAQNTVTQFSNGTLYPYLGAQNRNNSSALVSFDGEMTEVNFIDGQSLTASSFGSFNTLTGVWQPAKYTGTYGTNGFYLPFTNTTSTSTLGNDFSGNGNNWTTNNFSLTTGTTYDSMTDVPTLTSATTANYCVFNPLAVTSVAATFTNANLTVTTGGAGGNGYGSFAIPSSGKWYWEITMATGNNPMIGISAYLSTQGYAWSNGNSVFYYVNGQKYVDGTGSAYGASYTTSDVIGIAIDADAGTITFYKNNVSQGSITHVVANLFPCLADGASATTDTFNANFGQRPFTYTPPTGFVALNAYNLPTSTIVKGNTVMDAVTYTGSNSSQSVVNGGSFKPDFTWFKSRNTADGNDLVDSVRGTNKNLYSNTTGAEDTVARVTSFDSNGVTLAGGYGYTNASGQNFVSWMWQAGQGSSSSNTNGSITSTVSVNASAGFSVVTYTGTGSNATVGHGLGVAPSMMIVRCRNATQNWAVGMPSIIGNGNLLYLNGTNAVTADATVWNSTAPTSTTIAIGTSGITNGNTYNYVAYCWAEIAGFSKFGSYTGNGSTDGTFVYLGFRPKFLMIKASSTTGNWNMVDTTRNPSNVIGELLYADASDAGATYTLLDGLSNGFKLRNAGGNINNSGTTFIYMAFAENPFKNALAR